VQQDVRAEKRTKKIVDALLSKHTMKCNKSKETEDKAQLHEWPKYNVSSYAGSPLEDWLVVGFT
jgi:hypothetical protein